MIEDRKGEVFVGTWRDGVKRVIFPHSTYTMADGFDIVTYDLIHGDELDRHTVPESHWPFLDVLGSAFVDMIANTDVLVKKYMLRKTPFLMSRNYHGGFNVRFRGSQAVYDLFLVIAGMFDFEASVEADGIRLLPSGQRTGI